MTFKTLSSILQRNVAMNVYLSSYPQVVRCRAGGGVGDWVPPGGGGGWGGSGDRGLWSQSLSGRARRQETRPALPPRYMACSSHSLQSGTWDGKFNHHFITYLISNSKPYYLVKFNFVLDLSRYI